MRGVRGPHRDQTALDSPSEGSGYEALGYFNSKIPETFLHLKVSSVMGVSVIGSWESWCDGSVVLSLCVHFCIYFG